MIISPVHTAPLSNTPLIPLSSAPYTPPSNLSFSILNSTVIELTWLPPSIEDRNGIISYYWIQVYEANTSAVSFSLLREVKEDSFPVFIQDLHPFYFYQLRMSAVTVEPGPFTDLISWKLPEDGNLYHLRYACGAYSKSKSGNLYITVISFTPSSG